MQQIKLCYSIANLLLKAYFFVWISHKTLFCCAELPLTVFNINNSTDKLNLLKADFEKLLQDPLNISLAEKACSDAWHLSDWMLNEMKEKDSELTMEVFRTRLYSECPEMRILHDLANTFKHKQLTNPKAKIIETKVHGGSFDSSFSKAFDVSRLEVHYADDRRIDVDDLIELAIKYWDNKWDNNRLN